MQISFHKNFIKRYKKLHNYQKKIIDNALDIFINNHYDQKLNNHALKGEMKGLRSISAAFDLRMIFYEKDDYVEVMFLSVGTHNQVYSK